MHHYSFQRGLFDSADGRLTGPEGQCKVLRPKVAQLLDRLLQTPNEVVSKHQLVEAIWADGTVVEFETGLAALLKELRQAFTEVGLAAELIETLPRRGLRINTTVSDQSTQAVTPKPQPLEGIGKLTRHQWLSALLTLTLLVVVATLVIRLSPPSIDSPDGSEQTLVILPFEVFTELGDGMSAEALLVADAMLTDLWTANLSKVSLLGRASTSAYGNQPDLAKMLADDLGADLVIEGRVLVAGETIEVSARLLQAHSFEVLWSDSVVLTYSEGQRSTRIREASRQLIQALSDAWPLAFSQAH